MIMKNVSRNKLLLCFRPVVDMDHLVLDSENQAFRYRKIPGMKHSQESSSSPSSSSCSTSSDNSMVIHSHSPRRNFSRAIRAVFFETMLFKRVRDKKGLFDQKSCGSSGRSSSFNSQKALQIIEHRDDLVITNEVFKAEVSKPEHRVADFRQQQSEKKNQAMRSNNIKNQPNPNQETILKPKIDYSGMHLLLITLALTIIWGKLCAIIFTSIWLYFMPPRQAGTDSSLRVNCGRKIGDNKGRNKEYKKRIIMEGLLERNHRLSNQSQRERSWH